MVRAQIDGFTHYNEERLDLPQNIDQLRRAIRSTLRDRLACRQAIEPAMEAASGSDGIKRFAFGWSLGRDALASL